MIKTIINGIFNLIISAVNLLFLPINLAIDTLLPDVSSVLVSIQEFMYLPLNTIGWLVSLLHIPALALNLIVVYWGFKYAIVSSIGGIKYVISVYKNFKL